MNIADYDNVRLLDPRKGNAEIDLWSSDQGFADYEFHVTHYMATVVTIARHFAGANALLPGVSWETDG